MRSVRSYVLMSVIVIPAVLILAGTVIAAKSPARDTIPAECIAGLKFRSIGPALMSGRIASIAVDPGDINRYFIGVASGGVWRTTNAGTTWIPVFDNQGSYSIGTVTIDPKNPLIVWVGTGENNSQRSVGYGDGVYRSEDGGNTWKNMGLQKSEHIARIVVDPRNSTVVFVAAQGPLWAPGGDRGLFKSTDAGKSWKSVLSVSENTGVSDLVMDPKNPDVMYASSYQRRRHVWTLIDGGPESAIYKTTDGGATWAKIISGLPAGDLGRIGLAIAPADPKVIYATVEAASGKSGFFRSVDAGATWEKRSGYIATSPQYYGTIVADPADVDRVYLMDTFLMVSDDGGRTFTGLGEKSKHVDNHAMWINPANTKHYRVGCDGGLYESFDRGQNWRYHANLPITQFYDVCVDESKPFYYVYGGTQDNNTIGGPSRTTSASGIANSDWFITTGGDGFQSRVDPVDPNTVYSESQYGGLVRFDRATGEQMAIQPKPAPGEQPLRWNWDSPLMISPHSHTRLYFGANRLYRSDNRGDEWHAVSGDLTRQIDRNSLPVMGKIWNADAVAKNASTSLYGNCTAMTESPVQEGRLYVGTDDGLVNITPDGGKSWTRAEKFPGVPERTYVSRLLASQHDARTVYASFDNHKNADFHPYILRSRDAGSSWEPIAGNLPANGPVLAIAEDYKQPDLLFAGTEFGIFVTTNGGSNWTQIKGGLPTVAVRDIAIQKRENDLVIATFGRGFYVLDNYSPLREFSAERLSSAASIFPVKPAVMYLESYPLGGSKKSTQGEAYFNTPNPPIGAMITYAIRDSLTTKRSRRLMAERDAEKNHQSAHYPSLDELRAEDREEAPSYFLTISDSAGNAIRRIGIPNAKGVGRVNWDLRYPLPMLVPPPEDGEPEGGPLVIPGTYLVTLSKRVEGVTTVLTPPQPVTVTVPGRESVKPADLKIMTEFQLEAAGLQRAVYGAVQTANEVRGRLNTIRRALQETPGGSVDQLVSQARTLQTTLENILVALRGDPTAASRNDNQMPSISDRINSILDEERYSTSLPTRTHRDDYASAGKEFTIQLERLKKLVRVDLAALEAAMDTKGAPWTPGRLPDWQQGH